MTNKLISDVAVLDTTPARIESAVSERSYRGMRITVSRSSSDYEIVISQGELINMLCATMPQEPEVVAAMNSFRQALFRNFFKENSGQPDI